MRQRNSVLRRSSVLVCFEFSGVTAKRIAAMPVPGEAGLGYATRTISRVGVSVQQRWRGVARRTIGGFLPAFANEVQAIQADFKVLAQVPKKRGRRLVVLSSEAGDDSVRALALCNVVVQHVGLVSHRPLQMLGKDSSPEEREIAEVLIDLSIAVDGRRWRIFHRYSQHGGHLFELFALGIAHDVQGVDMGEVDQQIGHVAGEERAAHADFGAEGVLNQAGEQSSQRMLWSDRFHRAKQEIQMDGS